MEKLKILVADESVLARKAITEAVENTGMGKVEHTAPNGSIAMEWLQHSVIDVVLLDAFMAGHNSLLLLKEIKKAYPDAEVILLSDGSPRCAEITVEALASGAFDFVLKGEDSDPAKAVERMKSRLNILFTQIKVKKFSMDRESHAGGDMSHPKALPLQKLPANSHGRLGRPLTGRPDLVLIAASTGGPAALERLLEQLPEKFPVPILIVQHMPSDFTRIFAQTLNKKCRLSVKEAVDGEEVLSDQVVIAAGDQHMLIEKVEGGMEVHLNHAPHVNGVRPSADVLFQSAAKVMQDKNVLVVILTGMGCDGMQGVSELKKRCHCYCITQSEESCVVYGMPRCVHEAGLSDETADIGSMAGRICRIASVEGL